MRRVVRTVLVDEGIKSIEVLRSAISVEVPTDVDSENENLVDDTDTTKKETVSDIVQRNLLVRTVTKVKAVDFGLNEVRNGVPVKDVVKIIDIQVYKEID